MLGGHTQLARGVGKYFHGFYLSQARLCGLESLRASDKCEGPVGPQESVSCTTVVGLEHPYSPVQLRPAAEKVAVSLASATRPKLSEKAAKDTAESPRACESGMVQGLKGSRRYLFEVAKSGARLLFQSNLLREPHAVRSRGLLGLPWRPAAAACLLWCPASKSRLTYGITAGFARMRWVTGERVES